MIAATNACSATRSVDPSAPSRVGPSDQNVAAMSLGFGKRYTGTPPTRQAISHTAISAMPTSAGATIDTTVSDCITRRMGGSVLRVFATVSSRRRFFSLPRLRGRVGEGECSGLNRRSDHRNLGLGSDHP